jgi:hypothetical protein
MDRPHLSRMRAQTSVRKNAAPWSGTESVTAIETLFARNVRTMLAGKAIYRIAIFLATVEKWYANLKKEGNRKTISYYDTSNSIEATNVLAAFAQWQHFTRLRAPVFALIAEGISHGAGWSNGSSC